MSRRRRPIESDDREPILDDAQAPPLFPPFAPPSPPLLPPLLPPSPLSTTTTTTTTTTIPTSASSATATTATIATATGPSHHRRSYDSVGSMNGVGGGGTGGGGSRRRVSSSDNNNNNNHHRVRSSIGSRERGDRDRDRDKARGRARERGERERERERERDTSAFRRVRVRGDRPSARSTTSSSPPSSSTSSQLSDTTTFASNRISTTKYSPWTFFPKFLYEQFTRAANLFFLFTACIQQIPGISPTSQFTTLLPLAVVLLVTAVKELFEDINRRRMDYEVNNRIVHVVRHGVLEPILWSDLQVGDIVRLENNEFVPADLVLLSSSEPDGICYIETSNLDGETNLKLKQSLYETAHLLTASQVSNLDAVIACEQPNNSLYTFDGILTSRSFDRTLSLGPFQLLLRGCQMRNTPWIYGVVVFTGSDTKLFRNSNAAPIKRTSLEKLTNIQIMYLFVILLFISLLSAGINLAFERKQWWYLDPSAATSKSRTNAFFANFLTFIILYNNLIPISLIVTMEIVKFLQAEFINSDIDMYYAETDTPARARTSNIIEELGKVRYVLSDKTGTLTRNEMVFLKCSVGGMTFHSRGMTRSSTASSSTFSLDQITPAETPLNNATDSKQTNDLPIIELLEHRSDRGESFSCPFGNLAEEFLTALAVCHTVIPEADDGKPFGIGYQASSPDEAALVEGVRNLGYVFKVRRPKSLSIDVEKRGMVEFEVLTVLEFNSKRKRMSIIVRTPSGKIKLYCKGADNVILERLGSKPSIHTESIVSHLENFASDGLRTLCFAAREISLDEYVTWKQIFETAATALENREYEMERAMSLIEQDLYLLGATAVEDRLQDGVPETVRTLQEAGIRMWVLTGDRMETAVNIGFSCSLLTEEMNLLVCPSSSAEEIQAFLKETSETVRQLTTPEMEELAFLVDGPTLEKVAQANLQGSFMDVAIRCRSVICCRVSPIQKAQIVKLVQKHQKAVTLAIGDGANDVGMIQAAEVGVGISGKEGLQAARAADFSIGQFSFLRKLLLVHGIWSYRRLAKVVLYSFYKNITLYMIQFWFAFFNGFSGQTIFEDWILSFYNVLFTFLPPIVIGIVDQFLPAHILLNNPALYSNSSPTDIFSSRNFWNWIANAFLHSIIVFFFGILFFDDGVFHSSGRTVGLWFMGTMMYTFVVMLVTLKAALITDFWPWISAASIWGSLLFWFLFIIVYGLIWPGIGTTGYYISDLYVALLSSASFWLGLLLFQLAAILRDFSFKYYHRMYRPSLYVILQEIHRLNLRDTFALTERFTKRIRQLRVTQRLRRNRGYAFSQTDTGQGLLLQLYDSTVAKPGGL